MLPHKWTRKVWMFTALSLKLNLVISHCLRAVLITCVADMSFSPPFTTSHTDSLSRLKLADNQLGSPSKTNLPLATQSISVPGNQLSLAAKWAINRKLTNNGAAIYRRELMFLISATFNMCNYEDIMERYYCKVALSVTELCERGV